MDFLKYNKIISATHLIFLISGFSAFIAGSRFEPSSSWFSILISIGASLIASSFVSWVSYYYLVTENKLKDMITQWGLKGLYKRRGEINPLSETLLKTSKTLDIAAYGLKSFRDARHAIVEERIKNKSLKIRILTLNPDSGIVNLIDQTEGSVSGATAGTIRDLIEWVKSMKSKNIEIRLYDSLPMEFYFRYDNDLFVGPHWTRTSQQTPTWHFTVNGDGAIEYAQYFEDAWKTAQEV